MGDLDGIRIAVTRPQAQAGALLSALQHHGALTIPCPVIRVAPPDDMLALANVRRNALRFDWIIFTSANGVEGFLGGGSGGGRGGDLPNVAAIGPATAHALEKHGIKPDFVPQTFLAREIPFGLGDLAGKRVLLPRADIAGSALPAALSNAGATVTEVVAYQTLTVDPGPEAIAELQAGVDAITFTSPSTVKGFVAALRSQKVELSGPLTASIGPVTLRAVSDAGFANQIVAERHTSEGLLSILREYFRGRSNV